MYIGIQSKTRPYHKEFDRTLTELTERRFAAFINQK